MTETATATNPSEATASTEASATLLGETNTDAGKTQETQTAETQTDKPAVKPAEAQPNKESAAAEGTPEKYEFKAPEGTEYDSEILESFSDAAKEAGLTQDAAQKLIEKMAPAITARQTDQIQAIHKEWQTSSASDKEFGGEKLAENLGVARKALDTFGTPELRTLLDDTGLGNHPEFIRLLYRAGKAISEDTFVGGKTGAKAGQNPAAVLYDKTTEKG